MFDIWEGENKFRPGLSQLFDSSSPSKEYRRSGDTIATSKRSNPRTPHIATMPGQRGPVPVPAVSGNRDTAKEILDELDSQSTFQTEDKFPDVSQIEIKAALDRLASRSMITYETKESQVVVLTEEGETISKEGSHEYKVCSEKLQRCSAGLTMLCRCGKRLQSRAK